MCGVGGTENVVGGGWGASGCMGGGWFFVFRKDVCIWLGGGFTGLDPVGVDGGEFGAYVGG